MPHVAVIVPGSVHRQPQSLGVAFRVRCCDEHEVSVHIQNAHRYSEEELKRLHEDYLTEVAEQHEQLQAAEKYLATLEGVAVEKDCGCP